MRRWEVNERGLWRRRGAAEGEGGGKEGGQREGVGGRGIEVKRGGSGKCVQWGERAVGGACSGVPGERVVLSGRRYVRYTRQSR